MAIESVGSSVLSNLETNKWVQHKDVKSNIENLAPQSPQQENKAEGTFAEFLASSVAKVNDVQQQANEAMQDLATGKSDNLHETMLKVEQAELAFKQMNQIRMKVLTAYQEIMKMQV